MLREECRVYVGCCGFPFSRKRYYSLFRVVEVQRTFYDPPRRETLEKWRREAPPGFIFTIKAWQAVTHPSTSPTWRRMKRRPPGSPEGYGYLKPTSENMLAWRVTLEAAEALDARVIVLQTPASMPFNSESVRWVDEFFSKALREAGGRLVAWEPRGRWAEERSTLEKLLCKHGVIHVVDPLRRIPVTCPGQEVFYLRLHGRGGREVNYRYRYTEKDFEELENVLRRLTSEGPQTGYVMFNNIYMGSDAQRFRDTLKQRGWPAC